MISINLHDYRYELVKVEIQKRAVKFVGIILGALVLAGLAWISEQMKVDSLFGEVKQLENQVQGLSGDFNAIEKIKGKQKRVEQIISGIVGLRSNQLQAAQILADLNLNVPEEIWLTHVTQKTLEQVVSGGVPMIFVGDPEKLVPKRKKRKKKEEEVPYEFLVITGKVFGAFGDNAVVEYIEYLKTIPYFQQVYLHETSYELLGTFPVRTFRVYCYMPVKKEKQA